MKAFWILAAAALPVLGTCDEGNSLYKERFQIVALSDLTNDMLEAFRAGKIPKAAIHIPAGTELPFDFRIEGNLLNYGTEGQLQNITFPEDVYLGSDGKEIYICRDGFTWTKLCNFISGNANSHLLVGDEGPYFQVHIEMNQK